MTNGEKIKAMFSSMEVGFITDSQIGIYFVKNQHNATVFSLDWWNTEYKEPTTKNDLGVDCVSRQAILKIYDEWFVICNIADKKDSPKAKIKALPSVIPIRLKGKWIEERNDYGEITHWHCSNCYGDSGFITTCKWDYCPNCGADMREVE